MKAQETEDLAAVARLFGRLLLRELDEPLRATLVEEPLAGALSACGLDVGRLHGADLDGLAAEYLERFVRPATGGPLVQSLWTQGTYEGDAAVAARKLAEAAALDFDKEAARGAPVDHLGSLLLLWATSLERQPEVARRIEEEHLAWAVAPLERLAGEDGFYGSLAGAVANLVRSLAGTSAP